MLTTRSRRGRTRGGAGGRSTKRVLNLHREGAVVATIDFARNAEYESFDTPELRANVDRFLR